MDLSIERRCCWLYGTHPGSDEDCQSNLGEQDDHSRAALL